MPLFEYCHLNQSGAEVWSSVDAGSMEEARQKLRAAGKHVIHVREKSSRNKPSSLGWGLGSHAGRVKTKDVAQVTRQLSALLLAGIPLVEALEVLVEQLGDGALSQILAQVRDRVNAGASLAEALGDHAKVFPRVYISMVRAGQSAGALDGVLSRLADMYDKRLRLLGKVRAAMTYPVFMVVVGGTVILFVLSYVLPSITKLFLDMNMELPWVTRVLMALSQGLSDYGFVILMIGVALFIGFEAWRRSADGRVRWDRFKLQCPVWGKIGLSLALTRFARTLGVLLSSGVTIEEALELSERVIDNQVIAGVVGQARQGVTSGQSLSQSLSRETVLPPVALHMIAAGERTGTLDEELVRLADTLDREIEENMTMLTSLVEPVLIIVLGILVGFIVMAILLPIFDINRAIM